MVWDIKKSRWAKAKVKSKVSAKDLSKKRMELSYTEL